MCASLVMDTKGFYAKFPEVLEVPVRGDNHQMGIHWLFGNLCNCLDYRETIRYIWNEDPIHNIKMKPICTAIVYHFNLLVQYAEICREHRRSDNNTHGCLFYFN